MNIEQAKKILAGIEPVVKKAVASAMKKRKFSYKTFGNEIEPSVLDALEGIFTEADNRNFKRAKDKNEFPDFTIRVSDGCVAIDIKAGNHYKKADGGWKLCKNSQNDLGTIREWPNKLSKFGGENIFFLFIEYSITDKIHQVEAVRIAPFYKFLDINKQGLIKYRKKDGNLRPKNFGVSSPVDSIEKFLTLIKKTEVERAKSIICEHIKSIPNEDRNAFIDELKID